MCCVYSVYLGKICALNAHFTVFQSGYLISWTSSLRPFFRPQLPPLLTSFPILISPFFSYIYISLLYICFTETKTVFPSWVLESEKLRTHNVQDAVLLPPVCSFLRFLIIENRFSVSNLERISNIHNRSSLIRFVFDLSSSKLILDLGWIEGMGKLFHVFRGLMVWRWKGIFSVARIEPSFAETEMIFFFRKKESFHCWGLWIRSSNHILIEI